MSLYLLGEHFFYLHPAGSSDRGAIRSNECDYSVIEINEFCACERKNKCCYTIGHSRSAKICHTNAIIVLFDCLSFKQVGCTRQDCDKEPRAILPWEWSGNICRRPWPVVSINKLCYSLYLVKQSVP